MSWGSVSGWSRRPGRDEAKASTVSGHEWEEVLEGEGIERRVAGTRAGLEAKVIWGFSRNSK